MIRATVQNTTGLKGVGLHSGALSTATIHPAEFGYGVRFETAAGSEILPTVDSVVDASRCTVLSRGEERLSTVEHILSAFLGIGITDARITVDGPEIPIGDGSARCWTDLIGAAGIKHAPAHLTAEPIRVYDDIFIDGGGGSFVAAYPSDRFSLTVGISFPHPLVGTQVARFVGVDAAAYTAEIAPARTFGFIEEVEALRKVGLAMGGSFDNAIVVYQDHISSPLRFDNEFARHKLLDVIGDLALSGSFVLPFADIIAVKPSHRLNVALARRLLGGYEHAFHHEG